MTRSLPLNPLKHAGLGVLALLLLIANLAGCAVNPVTGKKQLMLIPETQDLQIGREQYGPAQQSQGGIYVADPELTRYVSTVGMKLAAVSDRPDLPYEFVVLNNDVPNAWALPAGKIAVNLGLLLELEDEAQLAAVLGHEIVHAAARHSSQRMQQGLIVGVGMAGLGMALENKNYAQMVVGGAALGAQLAMARYGREHELESDRFGMQYMVKAGYDPQAAVEIQQLFVKLAEGKESGWLEGLFASHPPSQERVEANRRIAAELGNGGVRNREQYQQRLAYARSKQPAYAAEKQARAHLEAGRSREALNAINQAIRLEPREASFYAVRGEIYKKTRDDKRALEDYDKAISLNPNLFLHHLGRAEIHAKNNNLAAARRDFENANRLLPTGYGHLGLGAVAQAEGRLQEAVSLYQVAARQQGPVGAEAQRRLNALSNEMTPEPPPATPSKELAPRRSLYH